MLNNMSRRRTHIHAAETAPRVILCCKTSSEERSAGNLHATICGGWRWLIVSGDPVNDDTPVARKS